MKNANIASILRDIAFLLEMEDVEDNSNMVFKIRSYKRASDVIANLSLNVEEVYATHGLKGIMQIPSVGKAIALKIEEYLTTGKIQYLEELKSKMDIDIDGFYGLEGIGPKTIKIVFEKLGIRDLSGLEKAASEGTLRSIRGFSEKKEEVILKKIQQFKKGRSRYLIGEVYPLIKQIETRLLKFNGVKNAVVAGSFRRMKETVGDIDFVVASNDVEKVMDVAMRKIAIAKGLHLNEWGIFDTSQHRIAGSTEQEVYQTLDLEWIPPEMRENLGEVELAKKGGKGLPKLIGYNDLKGDLQVHSNSTDGTMSIEEMALAANEKFGLQYIVITDHTKSLKLTNGLDEKQLLNQENRIAELNDRTKRVFDKTERQRRNELDSSPTTPR